MPDTETVSTTKQNVETMDVPPRMYGVVLFNDNKTTFEFVILILMQLFGKDYETACELTSRIHDEGRGTVHVYTYEVAISKRDETVQLARANGYPLKVEVEAQS